MRLSESLDNWHIKLVRLSALSTGRLYPLGDEVILLKIFLEEYDVLILPVELLD